MFTVIKPFKDIIDNKHEYLEGDMYPREGAKKPTKKRIAELMSEDNKAGYPLIEEIVAEEEVTEDETK